jgi:4-hydroxythreonine-4-phosphate dehydrogenase
MSEKLDLLVESLHDDFGIVTPRIAISGLNPHSGEQGQLGTEEAWLTSWMDEERNNYPETQLDGPVSPDTLWVKAGQAWYAEPSGQNFSYYADIVPILKEEFGLEDLPEAFLALYHDQGLIPVKLLAFDRAVNTTIGLPFVRTSPDHGTAFDIAGQGVADETSMKEAILLAAELVKQKQAQS